MFGILAETFGFQSKSDSNQLSCNEFFREVRDKISQYSALFVVLPFDAKCQLKHQVLAKFTQTFHRYDHYLLRHLSTLYMSLTTLIEFAKQSFIELTNKLIVPKKSPRNVLITADGQIKGTLIRWDVDNHI